MRGGSLFSDDKSHVLSPYMIRIHSEKSRSTYNAKNDFPPREFCTDLSRADRDARRKGWRKNEEERGNERKRERDARGRAPLIRSSGGLSPSSCTLLGEYRLSVVRLGVLHSSKYLGIFEESRVPKKTVYSARRDPSRESERAGPGTVIASVFRRQSNTPASRMPGKNIQREDIRGALYTKRYRAYVRVSDSFHRTHRIRPLSFLF